jgi:lipooligosaccharide transport system ATP-binding protein
MKLETDNIIEARALKKHFNGFTAVDGITFELHRGECLGLLGPNGAGKTSTIRMIYGFSPISEGELKVFGIDLPSGLREIKFRIGICQQENSLDPDLTVRQNLEIYAKYFDIPPKTAKEKAMQLLNFISLDHRENDKVTGLSGGMMRRLVIARALINDPELLILDEPTTGLDPQTRHQVWERLDELRSNGLSILLTTHYMEEAAQLCDRLIIMDQGKILVCGRPSDLVRQYAGREVMEVYGPSEELLELVREQGYRHDLIGTRVIIYGGEEERLFESIGQEHCLGKCVHRMATLEDVFLRLTGRGLRE